MSFRARLRGGLLNEGEPGLALLTGRLLAEGTKKRGWQEIVTEAESYGMYLQSFASGESIGVAIDAIAADAELALEWMAEILTEPIFPEDRFEWLRKQAMAELDSLLDQPQYRTGRAFSRQLYGEHPYGRALHGSTEALAARNRDECEAFHRQTLAWGGCIVVTGAIDEDAMLGRLEERFRGILPPSVARPLPPPPQSAEAREQELVSGEADQAHVFSGHLTVERRSPDLPALDLLGWCSAPAAPATPAGCPAASARRRPRLRRRRRHQRRLRQRPRPPDGLQRHLAQTRPGTPARRSKKSSRSCSRKASPTRSWRKRGATCWAAMP